jgi:hypothetical protein
VPGDVLVDVNATHGPDRAKDQSTESVGYGEDPTVADLYWAGAAADLTPDKTLARVNANARATVTTVAVVGTVLSGLGLISAQTVAGAHAGRWLALGAVAFAIVAVLCGLAYLALRLERLNVADFGDVERWYRAQFRRAWLAMLASWLLVVAVVLAASSAVATLVDSRSDKDVALDLQLIGNGNAQKLQVGAKASGLDEGALVVTKVVGLGRECPEVVLLESRSTADASGKVETSSMIDSSPCSQFRVDVTGNGVRARSLTFP